MKLETIEIQPPAPIEVSVSEEEILADLLYPAAPPPRR